MTYVLKAALAGELPKTLRLTGVKTMYGGKNIALGDRVFIISSEHDGGIGLVGRGSVSDSTIFPRPLRTRWTPRVNLVIEIMSRPVRPLGRTDLRPFDRWGDGQPQTELNFKLYRQATNKLAGISSATADWLDGFFESGMAAQTSRSSSQQAG